jgi:amidase
MANGGCTRDRTLDLSRVKSRRIIATASVLLNILRFTAVFDFSGSPNITLPVGMASARMPLSMQLVGPHLSEEVLARAAHAFQSTTDWHTQRPPIG